MKCGACTYIGTNAKGPRKHTPGCPAGEPLQPLDRIMACRRIVKYHQAEELEGILIDVQTANAIVTVYDALNDENKAKYLSYSMERMGVIARQSTWGREGA